MLYRIKANNNKIILFFYILAQEITGKDYYFRLYVRTLLEDLLYIPLVLWLSFCIYYYFGAALVLSKSVVFVHNSNSCNAQINE